MTTEAAKQAPYNPIDNIPLDRRDNGWKPGQSGNPHGRPKNSVTAMLKANSRETNEVIAVKLTDMAKDGDLKAIDMYIDRTDGKQLDAPQDNRVFNIVVSDRAAEAIAKLNGRTKLLTGGE